MGTRPCRRRGARLTAGALLTLQISFIALAADGPASADTARPPLTVMVVDPPLVAPSAAARRATVTAAHHLGALETARRYTRSLYRRAQEIQARPAERARPAEKVKPPERTAQHLPPLRLRHAEAAQRLRQAGLGWKSSGGCTNRNVRQCTSLEAVRTATVTDVIALKRRSGCPVVITGGTEIGHSPGPYSHHAGYKLDIKPNRCISRYIKREYPYQRVRGDGAPLYGSAGTVYAREPDHWDILFR